MKKNAKVRCRRRLDTRQNSPSSIKKMKIRYPPQLKMKLAARLALADHISDRSNNKLKSKRVLHLSLPPNS